MSFDDITLTFFEALFALAYFLISYAICCLPGIGFLWIIRKGKWSSLLLKEIAIAFFAAIFLTPYLLIGPHSALLLTIFVAVVAPPFQSAVWPLWLISGPILVFACTFAIRQLWIKRNALSSQA